MKYPKTIYVKIENPNDPYLVADEDPAALEEEKVAEYAFVGKRKVTTVTQVRAE